MKKLSILFSAVSIGLSSLISAVNADDDIEFRIKDQKKDFSRFSIDINVASKHFGSDFNSNKDIGYYVSEQGADDSKKSLKFMPFNEINPGLTLRYKLPNIWGNKFSTDVGIGFVKNSFEETATILTYGIQTTDRLTRNLPIGAGIEFMLVDGYDKAKENNGALKNIGDWPVLPVVLPHLRIGKESSRFTAKIGWIPKAVIKALGASEPIHITTLTFNAKLGRSPKRNSF